MSARAERISEEEMLLNLAQSPQPFAFSDHYRWNASTQETWWAICYRREWVAEDRAGTKGGTTRYKITKAGRAAVEVLTGQSAGDVLRRLEA